MDFSEKYMEEMGHGIYTWMAINILPPLYLVYAVNHSDSWKAYSTLRQR